LRNPDGIESGWVKQEAFSMDVQQLSSRIAGAVAAAADAAGESEAASPPREAQASQASSLLPAGALKGHAVAAEDKGSEGLVVHEGFGGRAGRPSQSRCSTFGGEPVQRSRSSLGEGKDSRRSAESASANAPPISPANDATSRLGHLEPLSPAKTPISSMLRKLQDATAMTDRQRQDGSDTPHARIIPKAQWRHSPKVGENINAPTKS
jgi:hypothetical protein